MIHLQRLTATDDALYPYVEELLVASFPREEYRDLDEQRRNVEDEPRFHCNVVLCDGAPTGLLTCWMLHGFCYVEHFAIDPARRNGGLGGDVIALLCRRVPLPVVLEVECPDTEMARRRIGFYQRQGFVLWNIPYLQPPYRPGDGFLPMHLMTCGEGLSETDFDRVQREIHREIYNYPLLSH